MPEGIQRTRGRPTGYKFDRAGTPAEFGPFIGVIKNNVDPTRTGRLQVYIEQFAGANEDDPTTWRTVSYLPPFYGTTNPPPNAETGIGSFTQNLQSYGMWFTPPDIGTEVICVFIGGDPARGYYIGCVPWQGIQHMLPAIGASQKFQLGNDAQASYYEGAKQLPVTEINDNNLKIAEDPRYFDKPRPVHSFLAGIMMQQGLIKDTVRGPITSNSQRESPSAVFGISTPGRPVYQGGLDDVTIKSSLEQGKLKPQDVKVIARRGGHSMVLDDGSVDGTDNLVRIRTSKGHQITMSDDGDCFYVIHANGQTWIEFGKEGTVDVFASNSVNVRTKGTINLHADKDINMFAGQAFNIKATTMKVQTESKMDLYATGPLTAYSRATVGIKSDSKLTLDSTSGGWASGAGLSLKAGCINLNSGSAGSVTPPDPITITTLPDTFFKEAKGWVVEMGALKSIVTRAPTHEPYPYHNKGVENSSTVEAQEATEASPSVLKVMDGLKNVNVANGITVADLAKQPIANMDVGTLGIKGTTGVLSQIATSVGQAATDIGISNGLPQIGTYGLTPENLSGYLKPGMDLVGTAEEIKEKLMSPQSWTGKGGIGSVQDLLVNGDLQSKIANESLEVARIGLMKSGVITGKESPEILGSFISAAKQFGNDAVASLTDGKAPPEITTQMNQWMKDAQYAVKFANEKAPIFAEGIAKSVEGFSKQLDRSAVDKALKDVIGNDKVPLPKWT